MGNAAANLRAGRKWPIGSRRGGERPSRRDFTAGATEREAFRLNERALVQYLKPAIRERIQQENLGCQLTFHLFELADSQIIVGIVRVGFDFVRRNVDASPACIHRVDSASALIRTPSA